MGPLDVQYISRLSEPVHPIVGRCVERLPSEPLSVLQPTVY